MRFVVTDTAAMWAECSEQEGCVTWKFFCTLPVNLTVTDMLAIWLKHV